MNKQPVLPTLPPLPVLFIRSLIYNVLYFGSVGVGSIIACLLFFMPTAWHMCLWNCGVIRLGRFFLRTVCGLKIEVRGAEHIQDSGVIYASKHESALETYVMTTALPKATIILKKGLMMIPFFGWALHFYGAIKIDRSAGGAAMKSMLAESEKALKRGNSIIIFPEGTRVKPGAEPQYKPGIYFMESNLKVPVIPVALNTGLFWKKNSFLRYPGTAVFEFLEPMPQGLGKKEFMEELERRIESKCRELNEEAVAKYPYTLAMMEKTENFDETQNGGA